MTAKMLNRQSMKAHKESEVQKAKVKKVPPDPPAWDTVVGHAGDGGAEGDVDRAESRLFNRETTISRAFTPEIQSERNRNDLIY